jgi:hypothetical protein
MADNSPPVMYEDSPGFNKCLEIFKTWNDHQSLDFDEHRISLMRNNHNPSKLHAGFLTNEEFLELTSYIIENPIWHLFWEGGSALSNVNEDFPNYQRIMELTVDKIKKIRGDFLIDNMFIRRAVNSLPLHTDHVYNFSDRVPTSTYVFPLAVERHGEFVNDWSGVSTVMLEQYQYLRAYGADIFAVEGKTGKPFPEEHYHLVSQHTKEAVDGLSLETHFEWSPGAVLEMDAYRLHCSNNWRQHGYDAKWGLIIQTAVPIPKN